MAETLIIRFPDRETAFRQSAFTPVVGDRFTMRGTVWVVVRIADGVGSCIEITVQPTDAGGDFELHSLRDEERELDLAGLN